jgi:type IV pilus assembly protein PilY1
MTRRAGNLLAALLAIVALASLIRSSQAGTDEAWLHRATVPAGSRPLLGVILDRSAATSRLIAAQEDYDPTRDYGAALPADQRCDPTKAYFRRGPGPAPDCARQGGIEILPRSAATGLQCEAARVPLGTSGFFIASRAAQWRANPAGGHWDAPSDPSAAALECRADRGRHGAAAGDWYASAGTSQPWIGAAAGEIAWDRAPFADAYILYAGNFLNYLRRAHAPVERPLADLFAIRLSRALASTDELDVALLQVDDNGPDGGYVARAPMPSAAAAIELPSLATTPPTGAAPLAETLAEAASWLAGLPRRFGTDGRADPAATNPPASGTYRSPIDYACRAVSLGFLTAGEASADDQAAGAAEALPHFLAETGGCNGDCLGPLAAWLAATDLRDDLPGIQSAATSWIAPMPSTLAGDVASAADPLAFINLVASAFQRDAAVAANPQLSAAGIVAFDASDGAPGVILGLTAPRPRERWAGNLLRYALRSPAAPLEPPTLVDRDDTPAIDAASGLPRPDSSSLWSDASDANLLGGGAAGRLPPADARRLFTDVASTRLLDAGNRLVPGNTRINRALLGLGPTDPETADDVLAWMSAQDTLGDPGPQSPAVIAYPDAGRQVAVIATQDGMIQAFDVDSGIELWGWMPKELLPRTPTLMRDMPTTARSHGVEGPLVLNRYDPNGDGRIDVASGEHLWLLFALGRGGNRYYALDVARPDDPRLLWSWQLPDAGVLSLAEPVVTRLAIAGSGQSAGEWVVLLAGGYDPRFDANGATGGGAGAAIHVLDALSGRPLWSAGDRGDLRVPGLDSLPSAPRALDLDGDRLLDHAYALDVMGSLWRLDFKNERPRAELASAQRLARLGDGKQRFFATPDVSMAQFGNDTRIAIAAGSGWITRPRDTALEDRMYVVFDHAPPGAVRELTDADLYDATDAKDAMPPDAPGWYVSFESHGAGEKVAGTTVTFDHALRFTTYQPLPVDEATPCGPPRSVARMYALDVRTALPHATAVESEDDKPEEIAASGLPTGARFAFPGRWADACEGCRPRPFGIIGGETFDPGYAGDPVRTSWRKLPPPPVSP